VNHFQKRGEIEMGFFDIILKPQPTMEAEKSKADTMAAVKTYAIYGAIIGLLIGIVLAFLSTLLGAFGSLFSQGAMGFFTGLGIAAIIVMPIVVAILSVIGSAISYGIYWIIAKLLGGTGTFTQNYYLGSKLVWPVLVATIIAGILQIIPILGQIIYVVWLLYTIYLAVVLLSVANSISKVKAFIAWLIPVIIIVILMMALIGSLIASLGAVPQY